LFEELTADASLTLIEEEVRRFWQRHRILEAALAANPEGPAYVIAQQPLTAAGPESAPTTQAALLASGDVLARYRRMQGKRVHHQIGWAGHGLDVEVAVERAVEPVTRGWDLAQFNAACRSAALEGIRQGEALAARLGVWSAESGPDAYVTLAPQSVEKVWAALKRLWDAGQLRYERVVAPFCPRCVTPLSTEEAGRQAREVEGLVAGVYLPWTDEPNGYLLVWTSLPWMLVGLAGVAAHPEAEYVVVEVTRGRGTPPARLLLADAARQRMLSGEGRVIRRVRGKALRGTQYRPLFTFVPEQGGAGTVVLSDTVPLDEGSGLSPLVPAFDARSLAVAAAHHLSLPELTDETGRLGDAVTPWRGLSPLDAEALLVQDLQARGLLFHKHVEPRSQALCPYCHTPLVPLARRVWLAGDRIVSRDRAWGTPLPIWQCRECGQEDCVPGLSELASRSGLDAEQIDVHRPGIDRLALSCSTCDGIMRRVAPVLDAGLEAAVLPGAFSPEPGPAQLAVGTGDQATGWLGELQKIAALLHQRPGWDRALALRQGAPAGDMSLDLLISADQVRWSAYRVPGRDPDKASSEAEAGGGERQESPGSGDDGVRSRDMLRQAWALTFPPSGEIEPGTAGARAEAWLRVRLLQQAARVTDALEACDPGHAAAELAALIGDMQRWQAAARSALPADSVEMLSRLLAPFVPHLAEAMYQRVAADPQARTSVHLAGWPVGG
jgi:isoleucyl-tRNA synthetase